MSILVNNVGYLNSERFKHLPFEQLRTEAKINLLPIAVMTRLFLDNFMKREKSGIINLSSTAALIMTRGSGHYVSTKTFDDFLSRTVGSSQRNKIDVVAVRPGRVTTPMLKNAVSMAHSSAQQTASEAVNSLGRTDVCYGPLFHRLQAAFINLVDPKIISFFADKENDAMKQ